MTRHTFDLTLALLSPCFLGGAFQQPEFRIASLRGIWRYWYRALYGSGTEKAPGAGERELFGGIAAEGEGGGAASARARLVPLGALPEKISGSPWRNTGARPPDVHGPSYLFFSMGMNNRSYLVPGESVRLRVLVAGDDARLARARASLAAACAFSGLGARSRRLAGAVSLLATAAAPPIRSAPARDAEELARDLGALISAARREAAAGRGTTLPEYHTTAPGAFRAGVLKRTFAKWEEAAEAVGRAYALFRQFDPPGSRTRRRPDYDVAKAAASGKAPPRDQTIRRAAFGLPIGFRFRSGPGRVAEARPTSSDRRGSPLFLTLERLAGDRLAVVWCAFRSPLTPDGWLKVGNAKIGAPDFSLIDEMLGRDEWSFYTIAQ